MDVGSNAGNDLRHHNNISDKSRNRSFGGAGISIDIAPGMPIGAQACSPPKSIRNGHGYGNGSSNPSFGDFESPSRPPVKVSAHFV